ncbi:hypothetical protein DFP72DRAFT_857354 [Ephemerocybe angulata]|uniref:Uncharacterized protein n=1 Tax=Ephemerocybe angulata TaxID=980116 RepID=A0A8H6LXA0_9AGAR|nr:hypothetical protein DFP72DRAFT_857354 [Tulosesus angulatus]
MRVSFIHLLTALGALTSFANAYHDDYTFSARDLDELTTLYRREILADIATRDLLAEVAGRLEARAREGDKRPKPGPTKPLPPPWTSTLDEHLPMQAPVITTLVLSTAHACLDGVHLECEEAHHRLFSDYTVLHKTTHRMPLRTERVPNSLRERCGLVLSQRPRRLDLLGILWRMHGSPSIRHDLNNNTGPAEETLMVSAGSDGGGELCVIPSWASSCALFGHGAEGGDGIGERWFKIQEWSPGESSEELYPDWNGYQFAWAWQTMGRHFMLRFPPRCLVEGYAQFKYCGIIEIEVINGGKGTPPMVEIPGHIQADGMCTVLVSIAASHADLIYNESMLIVRLWSSR